LKLTVRKLNALGIRNIEIAKISNVSDVAVWKWREKRTIPFVHHKNIIKFLKTKARKLNALVEKL